MRMIKKMIFRLMEGLGHKNILIRVAYAFLVFFILLIIAYASGYFLLPEGSLKDLPIPTLMSFNESDSFLSTVAKTLAFNLFALGLIVMTNHFRVRKFTFGYLPLYTNTIAMGLFAGTDSFSGEISAYTSKGLILFLQIGLLEFSAYILACVATVGLAMWHAEKWRGEKFKKIRRFQDIRLAKKEVLLLVASLVLLGVAIFNEWRHIIL